MEEEMTAFLVTFIMTVPFVIMGIKDIFFTKDDFDKEKIEQLPEPSPIDVLALEKENDELVAKYEKNRALISAMGRR